MKHFLLRLFIFLAPVGLLLLGLEILQRQLPNNYVLKRDRMAVLHDSLETLILGSSHTQLGINPDSLDGKAFNLALTAQTLYFDHFLLTRYLDSMPRLRRVILPISYSSYAAESDRNPGDYNKSYHYAFFFGSTAFTDWYSIRRYSLVAIWSVKQSVDRAWAYYTRGDSLVDSGPNGWMAARDQHNLAKNGQESGLFHDQYYDSTLIPLNIARVTDIARLCRERHIELVLISTPMWRSYMEHIRRDRYHHMVSTTDSLSQALGIPYYNFTEDPRFVEEDYYDANHLRIQGANKLTTLLRDTLNAQNR